MAIESSTGMFVYLIANMLNGKIYVGQTRRGVYRRWEEHVSYALRYAPGNPHLDAAIRKHGPESFSVETIASASSLQELDELEQFWIDRLSKALTGRPSPFKGVPIPPERYEKIKASGIWQRSSTIITEEGRKRLSESRKGENNPNWGGKAMTPEGIEKMAASLRLIRGKDHHSWGHIKSQETRLKLSLAHKGKRLGPERHNYRIDVSDEDIKSLRDEGLTHQQIADRFGFSRKGIAKRLRKHGYV